MGAAGKKTILAQSNLHDKNGVDIVERNGVFSLVLAAFSTGARCQIGGTKTVT